MKHLLLPFTVAVFSANAQMTNAVYPYNPDADQNYWIGVSDLTEFLMVYGNEFYPGSVTLYDTVPSPMEQLTSSIVVVNESIQELNSSFDSLVSLFSSINAPGMTFTNVHTFNGSISGNSCGEIPIITQTVPAGKAWKISYLPDVTIRVDGVAINEGNFLTAYGTVSATSNRHVEVSNLWVGSGSVITLSKRAICGNCGYDCSYNVSTLLLVEEYSIP